MNTNLAIALFCFILFLGVSVALSVLLAKEIINQRKNREEALSTTYKAATSMFKLESGIKSLNLSCPLDRKIAVSASVITSYVEPHSDTKSWGYATDGSGVIDAWWPSYSGGVDYRGDHAENPKFSNGGVSANINYPHNSSSLSSIAYNQKKFTSGTHVIGGCYSPLDLSFDAREQCNGKQNCAYNFPGDGAKEFSDTNSWAGGWQEVCWSGTKTSANPLAAHRAKCWDTTEGCKANIVVTYSCVNDTTYDEYLRKIDENTTV